jgi:hypothetical protein
MAGWLDVSYVLISRLYARRLAIPGLFGGGKAGFEF